MPWIDEQVRLEPWVEAGKTCMDGIDHFRVVDWESDYIRYYSNGRYRDHWSIEGEGLNRFLNKLYGVCSGVAEFNETFTSDSTVTSIETRETSRPETSDSTETWE